MGQRNGWSYESVNYLTSCFRAWFPMKIIHMVNRHLLILLTKFSRGTSLFLSIFLPARILISLQKKRNSIILARTWKGNIDSKKMASCWWDRNKWQYTISAYKRRDIMYGDERIKKKKKERRQRVFPIVSLRRGTGKRSCRLLTAFFALRPALKESFSCRCCPLLETPRINCPPISHRVPSPPTKPDS